MNTKPLGVHSHNMIAALEDLTAVCLDAKMEVEIALQRIQQGRDSVSVSEAEFTLLYAQVRLEKLMAILQEARKGPYSYRRNEAENLDLRIE